ncbi:putative endo-beta-1,4-glucanase D [Cladobotryum mycophilum]|uniref:lytic cellulose monooxygenase (C4-dehydrogenating) n=1 Tax=Cladobotryum mycophilum TaxID=491253 RepID=A0ABR0T3W2_9HYPO
MKFVSILGLASMASAHTSFTTLFINGKNQGDGTCVRMPHDGDTATFPVQPITGNDMACGRDGNEAVKYVCPAEKASTLTFEFRLWPDAQHPGSIDPGHLGPCAVYLKKMDDILTDQAKGPGWFKIWEDGYNKETDKWCVDHLVENNGLLSVTLPKNLPTGYYLVRPEILALHFARHGDPQFYVGCAQIFVQSDISGPLEVPDEYLATIPGYVNADTPGLTYNIYRNNLPPYPIPGPKVFMPKVGPKNAKSKAVQEEGKIPSDCILKNGNWCAKALAPYSGEDPCWTAVKQCYIQSKQCWGTAPPVGSANCDTWSAYCQQMNDECEAGHFTGPPKFKGVEKSAPLPGPIPKPWNDVFEKGRDAVSIGKVSAEQSPKDETPKEDPYKAYGEDGGDLESDETVTIFETVTVFVTATPSPSSSFVTLTTSKAPAGQ